MRRPLAPNVPIEHEGAEETGNRNEGVLPQPVPVGGQLCQFVEGWKYITNDPYVLSIVTKGYRLRFTSPPLLPKTPWEIRFPQKIQGMREQIFLMHQKNAIPPDTLGFYSNVFLTSSLSDTHYKLSAQYRQMRRLRVQIDLQDAHFHVLIHPDSRKYLHFAFENKVCQFQVLPFSLNTAPQVFTRLGCTVSAYLNRQAISVIQYLNNWLIHHPDCKGLLCHQSQLLKTQVERSTILAGPCSGYPVPQASIAPESGESFPPNIQGPKGNILPNSSVVYRSVPVHGITHLGFRSHPTGSFIPQAIITTYFTC